MFLTKKIERPLVTTESLLEDLIEFTESYEALKFQCILEEHQSLMESDDVSKVTEKSGIKTDIFSKVKNFTSNTIPNLIISTSDNADKLAKAITRFTGMNKVSVSDYSDEEGAVYKLLDNAYPLEKLKNFDFTTLPRINKNSPKVITSANKVKSFTKAVDWLRSELKELTKQIEKETTVLKDDPEAIKEAKLKVTLYTKHHIELTKYLNSIETKLNAAVEL